MRVLILTQYYTPEPIPKPVELAEELHRNGHEVYVVTGYPHYPIGKLYPGYKHAAIREEVINGIRVIRTFEFPYHGRSTVGRCTNYLSFMCSAPLALMRLPKVDVMYVWHPPLTIGIAARLIAWIRRIPFVYDVQDIWPEAAVLSGLMRPGLLVNFLSGLEKYVYAGADYLLVVTEGAKQNLVRKGVPEDKISPMPHWVDETIFEAAEPSLRAESRRKYSWTDRFVVLFAGNLGIVQGLETVIRAADQLRGNGSILFVFIGDGSDKQRLQELTTALGLESTVSFLDRQPMSGMPAFMAAADALLVHLKDSELSEYVIPSKTMAYLAAGKPILMGMRGAAADLVKSANAGFVAEPEQPAQLAQQVSRMYNLSEAERNALGENGREFLRSHYSKKSVLPKYIAALERLIATDCGVAAVAAQAARDGRRI